MGGASSAHPTLLAARPQPGSCSQALQPLPTSPPINSSPRGTHHRTVPSKGVTGQGGARGQEVELSTSDLWPRHQPGGWKEARPPAQAGRWVLEEGLSVHH